MEKNKIEFLVLLDEYFNGCVSPVDTGQTLELFKERVLKDEDDYILQNDCITKIWEKHEGKLVKRFGTIITAFTTEEYTLDDIQNMLPGVKIKKI